MEDFDLELEDKGPEPVQQKAFIQPIYKEWFRSKTAAGFIAISPWLEARKFTLDVGSVDPGTNKVISSTQFYANALDLYAYMHSVVYGTATELYPVRSQCPSPESFVAFGVNNENSRVLKIHYWGAGQNNPGDAKGFAWKLGLFGGKKGPTGATEPIWTDEKSRDQIRRSRMEMHRIYHALHFSLTHYAVNNHKDGLSLLP